jgi:nitrogen fixation/metabolism regulation signal transduction histidine kinase
MIVLLVVAGVSFTMAKLLVRPVRRLKFAIHDAAMGDLDFRISHRRKDEFGELFDGFNLFAAAMQERLEAAERPSGRPRALEATRIEPSSSVLVGPRASGPGSNPDQTPFAAARRRNSA